MSYAQKTVAVDVDRVGGYHGAHSEGGTVLYSTVSSVMYNEVLYSTVSVLS